MTADLSCCPASDGMNGLDPWWLAGAQAGAAVGACVGGPVGAVVGGAVGAAIGSGVGKKVADGANSLIHKWWH